MKDRLIFLFAMLVFGTIGLVRRLIPYSSGMIALSRAVIGVLFLLVWMLVRKEPFTKDKLKKNLWKLILSGAMIGGNWIFLFEAYRFTTVSVATICYYMAPVFVVILSPFLLKEKFSLKKGICCACAFLGMVLVSGVLVNGFAGIKGVVLALLAACLYAGVMVMNKKIDGLNACERTMFQLAAAALSLIPYIILTEDFAAMKWEALPAGLLLLVGVFHTGFAYALYFGSMAKVPAQTVAILCYVDPVTAVLLSALVLREPLGVLGAIGVVLVVSSACVSELVKEGKRNSDRQKEKA